MVTRIMEIRVLGALEVADDGRSIELPSAKACLVLASLVVRANEVVSTDRLFEVLWGSQPPETATNTLQTYVAHLRSALEPHRARREPGRLLITRPPGYVLAIEPDGIDAVRFERLARQGRSELATSPSDATRTLRAALDLWRGEALADFTFEPFAQADITRLTELKLSTLEDRIGADLSLGDHRALTGELAQLTQEHPLRERLAGQYMVALYRSGRQAEALRAYRRLRETLVEQLGIQPNPTLVRLEQAILEQRQDLDWSPIEAESLPPAAPIRLTVGRSDAPAATRGREAAAAARWHEAVDLLSAADRDGALTGADLEALAEALLWTEHPLESLTARQRAHAAYVEEGNVSQAALMAILLAIWFGARLRLSVAGGWFQRAKRLLEDVPECPVHGFLEWAATMFAIAQGLDTEARESAERAFAIGQRFGVPDLQALGLVFGGYVRVRQGEVSHGTQMIDEAMTWAVSGQVAPFSAQLVFCRTIGTCYELSDYRRASEWMEVIAECFARTGVTALPGDCEAHSIGILIGSGAWSEGESRARRACAGMEPIELSHVGLALSEIGEIRLRMGDLDGAAEAFAKASENAAPPQPGTALLLLARGDATGAADCLTRGVDLWRDANAPYDRARTRALLARALFEVGETGRARGEQRAARTVFESLGARLDLIRMTEFNAAPGASA